MLEPYVLKGTRTVPRRGEMSNHLFLFDKTSNKQVAQKNKSRNPRLLQSRGSSNSVALKLRALLIAPVRGYGRGLMSVTGHLFGAEKFDELEKMFKYVMKISIFTTLVVMIAFIFLREYAFSIFSITGMENEIFWIAIGGTVLMVLTPVSMISAKMLDGFGKSMYSLMFTIIRIIFEVALIVLLVNTISNGACVLIGICCGQLLSSIITIYS